MTPQTYPAPEVLRVFREDVAGMSQREFAEAVAPYIGRLTTNVFWSRLERGRTPKGATIRAVQALMSEPRWAGLMEDAGIRPLTFEDWFLKPVKPKKRRGPRRKKP